MKTIKYIFNLYFIVAIIAFASCSSSNKIPCPSYWNGEGGDTRGTPLEKGADGKVAPEGASVRKSSNGIVKKKKSKKMNANYYRGKGKANQQ